MQNENEDDKMPICKALGTAGAWGFHVHITI